MLPVAAVGARGVPVSVGEADKTLFPVPVDVVTPDPPFATGRVPETWVVNPIFPYRGAVPTPPDIKAFPVATPANLVSVVAPEAKTISPIV